MEMLSYTDWCRKKETSISTGKSLDRSSVLSYANSQLPFYSNLWMGRKVVRAGLNLFLWPSYKSFQGASRYCIAIVVTGEQEGIDSTSQFQPRLYPTQPHSAQILYSSQPHSSLPFRDQSLRREETWSFFGSFLTALSRSLRESTIWFSLENRISFLRGDLIRAKASPRFLHSERRELLSLDSVNGGWAGFLLVARRQKLYPPWAKNLSL